MKTIEITRQELKELLENYGHHASVKVPIHLKEDDQYESSESEWISREWAEVMNNGIVRNPYAGKNGKQIGIASNVINAKNSMKYIRSEVKIYSSVFSTITGHYNIIK
jgi:hypothetical protein